MNIVVENKLFWEMVRPFLSNKTISSEKITLIDDDELIADEQKVANSFNDFFSSLVTIWTYLNHKMLTYCQII